MKTNHEILKLGLSNIDKETPNGLCQLFRMGIYHSDLITVDESEKILKYLHRNTPLWVIGSIYEGGYWWTMKDLEPRKIWLIEHIKLTTPKTRK